MGEPEPLGEILARGMAGAVRGKRNTALELVRANWSALVGERLSEVTRPSRLSRGSLHVAAFGGSWAAELCLEEKDLLWKLERALGPGVVRRIRVKAKASGAGDEDVAPLERGEHGTAPGRGKTEIGDSMKRKIEGIEDPEVREALERMVRASRTAGQDSRDQ